MHNSAAWTGVMPAARVDEKPLGMGRIIAISVFIVVVAFTISTWIFFQETRSLSNLATQVDSVAQVELTALHRYERWAVWMTVGTTVGGSGVLVGVCWGVWFWRRRWVSLFQKTETEWRRTVSGLQCQILEGKRIEEELQRTEAETRQRTQGLEYAKAQLESELNQLKRAEKNLSQQRQSLQSSKTVLEMHVEARNKELQVLQHRYEHILNSAGEGICGLDLDGRTIFANPAVSKITGWGREELPGKTEEDVFGITIDAGTAGAEGHNASEQLFRRKDGSQFPVEVVKSPINEDGRVVGSVLVFKDITDRKRGEEAITRRSAELARSNAELEQFAFVASHDLQEPLRKIQAFGDRLKLKCEGAIAPEAHDYLERMQSASARMRTLINDLLTFSRVIRNSQPCVPANLNAVIKEVISDLEVRIEKSGARVEVADLPTIEADPTQMRQLLQNLLSNALKFQAPGSPPHIKVTSRTYSTVTGDAWCEISVKDNGIGFDEKYLEKIFAVFQRLHGRGEYEGTGVGLAVCRRITDRHHGSITAKSKPGHGATFVVTLPVRQPRTDPKK